MGKKENIRKDIQKHQMEILKPKNTIAKIKN